MTNPWVGLRPFRSTEANLFFGRRRAVETVSNLVATLPTLVVYAPSGTGKSSLINAGLVPILEGDPTHVPVVITDPKDDIPTRIRTTLARAGWQAPKELALLDLLERHWIETDRRTVVIVDQFEERVNASVPTEELFATMAKLVHSGTDAACVLISVREDYLASLEPLMRRVPGLLNGSYRVPPLSRDALEEAVYGPLEQVDRTVLVERALVTRTIDDLKDRSSGQLEPSQQRFEPGFFQIIWSTLWNERQASHASGLDLEIYERLGGAGQILKDFTARILNELEPVQTAIFWAISRYLVLPTGAKTALTVEDLTSLVQPSDFFNEYGGAGTGQWLSGLPEEKLTSLVRGVLQRLTASDAPILQRAIRLDREEFELLHDLLGHIILDWRKEYRQTQEAEAAAVRNHVQSAAESEMSKFEKPGATLDHIKQTAFRELTSTLKLLNRLLDSDATESNVELITGSLENLIIWHAIFDTIGLDDPSSRPLSFELGELAELLRRHALEHEDDKVRRQLQPLVPRFAIYIRLPPQYTRPLELVERKVPREPFLSSLAGWVSVVVLATCSLILSYVLFDPILASMNVHYVLLTLGHLLPVVLLGYAFAWDDRDIQLPPGRRILQAMVIPYLRVRKFRRLPFTWPLPAVWINGTAVGVASIFNWFGFAPTAGYNEGMLLGTIGVAIWFAVAFDD